MDHPCTFGKSWELNALQATNHKDHLCTFKKLRSKILVNHTEHPCTKYDGSFAKEKKMDY
ncbi:hypothetical protein HanXRQr2_Chr11g0501831 [Helianthus annuus]|uniref:Uncharacterized protein n=1 Tax=Helianthus annuus TaxID=4232 RepID=A0A9K3HRH3_HELAN|nr:hypothetical protein HanXRQr2_Chr11g0501831 [Helianthus annuus]KAJ0876023.1 hypothetical protein HanPSC8_Chr11g0483651 [Helianthus annuus]